MTETSTIRLSTRNIKRLISLAGELQMNSSEMRALDDAIDHLFDCKKRLELIKEGKINER